MGHANTIIAHELGGGAMRQEYFWSPRNADNSIGGALTMRRGLENSVNIVTAHLLDGGISVYQKKSVSEVCATAVAAMINNNCIRYIHLCLARSRCA